MTQNIILATVNNMQKNELEIHTNYNIFYQTHIISNSY